MEETCSSRSLQVIKSRPRLFQFLLHIKPSHQKMSTTSKQSFSSAVTVIFANIEGLSAVKASMLSDVCKEQHCHCLCLQETHRGARKARPRIPGMTLVAERPHVKYGSTIFIRDNLKLKSISVTAANHVEVITAEHPNVVVHSVYKPPSEQFVLPPLGHRSIPKIVIRDFNSHSTIWGYNATDNNGVAVVQWAEKRVEQPNTQRLCETTEIFQQCKMEDRLQPRPHHCIFQH